MTMAVTQITYNDIDQTILRECFDKSLPFLDKAPVGNIIWEELGITDSHTADQKFEVLRTDFENALEGKTIIFKIDIDGRVVNYNWGIREEAGVKQFQHMMDLMREDTSGSQGWSYSTEYYQKISAFFKSVSEDCPTFSSWIIEGSGMAAAWDKSVVSGHITYTIDDSMTIADHFGHAYKKLIITVIV